MGSPRSSFKEKVDWMVLHPSYWKGWPTSAKLTDDQIIEKMQEDGLVSRNSNKYDILDFGKLIAAARKAAKIPH